MIEFSDKDFQLKTIRRESKLFNLQTKNPFRVYGLRTAGNPLVHISFNYDTVPDDFEDNLNHLVKWLQGNGIETQTDSGGGTPQICIGLRRDLRDHIVLCSAILQTIVYALEDRLELNNSYKIKGIPKFPSSRG